MERKITNLSNRFFDQRIPQISYKQVKAYAINIRFCGGVVCIWSFGGLL